MAERFFDRLEASVTSRGPLCVGLDPSRELIARWGLDDTAAGCEQLALAAIDAVAGVVGCVKPQVAFFERHGSAGIAALERTIRHAGDAGLLVIADAKRGDVATTNEAYAQGWLDDASALAADAVTATCYLGPKAIAPMAELAAATGRCVLVVAASSNDEGRLVQTAVVEGRGPLDAVVLEELDALGSGPDGTPRRCVGAVVGVTRRPSGLGEFTGPVLVPGLGAQGGGTADAAALVERLSHRAVAVSASREVLAAGPEATALKDAAARLQEGLRAPKR